MTQTQLAQLEEIIRQAQQQIEKLKNPKPKKFEWYYPDILHTFIVDIDIVKPFQIVENFINNGRYRLTKEAAEQILIRNKRANRLEALAEQLGGLQLKWDKITSIYIYLHSSSGYWDYAITADWEPEKVYMTKECAIEICRMLNEGEFSLEGDL